MQLELEPDQQPQPKPKRYKKKRCKTCQREMTWAAQRGQFGRLMRKRFSRDQAKLVLPLCGKCLTNWLRQRRQCATASDAGRSLARRGDDWDATPTMATEGNEEAAYADGRLRAAVAIAAALHSRS